MYTKSTQRDADKARSVFAIKRSKNPGFAGLDNQLYFSDRTWMLFGDAKNVIGELVKQFAAGSGTETGIDVENPRVPVREGTAVVAASGVRESPTRLAHARSLVAHVAHERHW